MLYAYNVKTQIATVYVCLLLNVKLKLCQLNAFPVLIVTSAIICDTGQIYMSVLLSPQEKRRRPNEYL